MVSRSNPVYQPAMKEIRNERQLKQLKYENSLLWSPKFTPNNLFFVLVYYATVGFLVWYILYI